MNTMREKQVEEAVLRMDLMVRNPEHKEDIRRFEQEHESTVFLVVRMNTIYGQLDSLLFVGKYDDAWEMSREDVEDGYAMSYTINRDYPECSEMGSIAFRVTPEGVIIREG